MLELFLVDSVLDFLIPLSPYIRAVILVVYLMCLLDLCLYPTEFVGVLLCIHAAWMHILNEVLHFCLDIVCPS